MKTPLTLLVLSCLFTAPAWAQSGSPFTNGYARITKDSSAFYIDTSGAPAFDSLSGSFILQDDTSQGTLPEHSPQVFKGGKMGVLDLDGSWLLAPVYDSIDRSWPVAWKVSRDGKSSYFRRQGFVLPFVYEDVMWLDSNYFAVRQGGKWAVYSRRDDKVLIPFDYNDIDYCGGCQAEGYYVFASKGGKWGVVDFTGKVLVPFIYDHTHWNMRSDEWVECFSLNGKNVQINLNTGKVDTCNGDPEDEANSSPGLPSPLVGIHKGKKYGVADTSGRIIIPCIYDRWFTASKDSSLLLTGKGKRDMLLNLKGEPVLPPGYDTLEELDTGLFQLTKRGLLGLYHQHTGKITVPRYSRLEDGNYQLDRPVLEAYMGKRIGLIDYDGAVLIPPVYDYLDDVRRGGLIWTKTDRHQSFKTGLYSVPKRKLLIPVVYNELGFYEKNDQLLSAQKGDFYGILGVNGDTICPVIYDDISEIDSLHFLLKKHNRFKVLNVSTGIVDSLAADSVEIARIGKLLIVKMTGAWRLYDAASKTLIPGSYTYIENYGSGLFMVAQDSLFGFVDATGKVIVPIIYDNVSGFQHGIALIMKARSDIQQWYHYGYVDSTGRIIVPAEYDYSESYVGNYIEGGYLKLLKGEMGDKMGLADSTGKIIIPPVYDKIDILHPGTWFMVKKGDYYGLLDSSGTRLLPDTCTDLGADPGAPLYFPLLFRVRDDWKYITRYGKVFPFVVKDIQHFDTDGY